MLGILGGSRAIKSKIIAHYFEQFIHPSAESEGSCIGLIQAKLLIYLSLMFNSC